MQDKDVKLSGARGNLLADGEFIFNWDDGSLRKLVLVSNDGQPYMAGNLRKSVYTTWKDPSTWSMITYGSSMIYTISNFVGIKSGENLFNFLYYNRVVGNVLTLYISK